MARLMAGKSWRVSGCVGFVSGSCRVFRFKVSGVSGFNHKVYDVEEEVVNIYRELFYCKNPTHPTRPDTLNLNSFADGHQNPTLDPTLTRHGGHL